MSVVVSSVAVVAAPARTYASATTTVSARAQPRRNIGPFTRALAENSIRMTAMIGTGLIATPTA